MSKRITIPLLLLFCSIAAYSQDSLPRTLTIAIMDFEGRNVTQSDAASLADRFRYELMQTGRYDVMERNQMNAILQEQEFQKTDCVDQSCAVEAGRIIAVNKIVTGSVAKVGGIYTLNVKMLDVATGHIDLNIGDDCDCPIEKVLTEAIKRLALKLSGEKFTETNTAIAVQRGEASLFVKTDPVDAGVYLDGKLMDGRTPVTFDNLTAGRHSVMVKKSDMRALKEVELVNNKVTHISLVLDKQKTILKVMSNPSEAEVYLNTKPGVTTKPDKITPAIFENVSQDSVSVSLFKIGYNDTMLRISLVSNDINALSVQLSETGIDRIKEQRSMVRHRTQRSRCVYTAGATIVCAGAATALYILGKKDFDDALVIKDSLTLASIRDGQLYEEKIQANKDKSDAGNIKTLTSYILGGIAALGLGVTLVWFF